MSLFSDELQKILPIYGSALSHAHRMGATPSTVLRAMNGDSRPSKEFVAKLIEAMPVEHKAAIACAYLLDERPDNAPMVKVGTVIEGGDRLDRACASLPQTSRELLAIYVEAVLRDPEAGYKALEGLASLVAPAEVVNAARGVGLNDDPVSYKVNKKEGK
jgi:hypothetical protein